MLLSEYQVTYSAISVLTDPLVTIGPIVVCPQKKEDVRTCVQKINGDDSSNKDNTIANSNINNDDNDINSNEKKDKDINDSNKNYNDNDTNVNDNKDGNNNDDSDNSNKEINNDNENRIYI